MPRVYIIEYDIFPVRLSLKIANSLVHIIDLTQRIILGHQASLTTLTEPSFQGIILNDFLNHPIKPLDEYELATLGCDNQIKVSNYQSLRDSLTGVKNIEFCFDFDPNEVIK